DADDPRPHRARAPDGTRLRLSRLLGARLAQDGLQGPLPAAGAPDAGRLGARGELTRRAGKGGPFARLSQSIRAAVQHDTGLRRLPIRRPTTPSPDPAAASH